MRVPRLQLAVALAAVGETAMADWAELFVLNAVDDDAAHIQVSLSIAAGAITKDKLMDAAQTAGIHCDAAEL
ncbi:hypothetical protein [Candidatus Poriferisodalis sp.]|uniref:hypothetical protein n=1 Tax=Candidatus Poriferisodalis sp. TaxID=3101277 RepID=UPI003B5226E9